MDATDESGFWEKDAIFEESNLDMTDIHSVFFEYPADHEPGENCIDLSSLANPATELKAAIRRLDGAPVPILCVHSFHTLIDEFGGEVDIDTYDGEEFFPPYTELVDYIQTCIQLAYLTDSLVHCHIDPDQFGNIVIATMKFEFDAEVVPFNGDYIVGRSEQRSPRQNAGWSGEYSLPT